MQKLRKEILSFVKQIRSRGFALGVFAIMFATIVVAITTQTKAVFIRDEEQTMVKYTLGNNIDNILEDNGITTLANDIVEFSGFIGNYGEVSISRAFPVYITHDGRTQKIMTTDITVDELFKKLDISYDSNDIINIPANNSLAEDDRVVLQRVEYNTETVEEEIPFEVESRTTSLLRNGATRTIRSGKTGVKALTYVQKTVDGVVHQTELVKETVVVEPVDKEIIVGGPAPVSQLDFGYGMDGNGRPVNYKRVITNAVATGYNAGPRAYGASGMDLSAGYVAVNPKVIPYGTKMYITSADGKFVYGYAIAADTGIGLMQGVIDVDLYYDTYLESCLNGRRSVNIYILG